MSEHTPLTEAEVSPAIKAQNPDLETAWKTIAWWQQTCDYWHEEAQKGYALRDALAARTSTATADTGLRERVEFTVEEMRVIHEAHSGDARWDAGWNSATQSWRETLERRFADVLDPTAAPTADTGARDE